MLILLDKSVEFVVAIYDNVRVTNHYKIEEIHNKLSYMSQNLLVSRNIISNYIWTDYILMILYQKYINK